MCLLDYLIGFKTLLLILVETSDVNGEFANTLGVFALESA